MTSKQATQNTITIQPLYKWDSEESQMNYLNMYPNCLSIHNYFVSTVMTFICPEKALFIDLGSVYCLNTYVS